jgi:hypothetical protein
VGEMFGKPLLTKGKMSLAGAKSFFVWADSV